MLKLKSDRYFSVAEEHENEITIIANEDVKDTYLELVCDIDMNITGDEYVLFPACCYKGNQFRSLKKNYPPMFAEDEAGIDIENTITDVPRLEKDGSGSIQVTTGDLEWNRGIRTMEHIFKTQLKSGFFVDTCNASGEEEVNATETPRGWHLTRKSGDALYFLIKDFKLMEERGKAVPESFISGTIKLADALVKLWKTYGQYGQFVNRDTGEIIIGGSAAGALIPGALASAYQYFGKKEYIETAEESARMFWEKFALNGYTTGGPEEALQCPDSESAFALLESYVVLYEVTENPEWLEKAVYMTDFCSSWVVSYNYRFPESSEFGRLGMKTTGSVFANSQNKHSAPGICTLSGDSLYKVYEWTKNPMYLELAKDASLLNDDSLRAEPEKLPQGFICERVNISDWESERCIGGVFNGSCWAETSNLLVLAEVVPAMKKKQYF